MSSSDHKINVAFLVVAITFSLGLGSFDRLPYLLYKYSDTPFLLIYFLATIFLMAPILLMEMYLGTPKPHKVSSNLKKIIPDRLHFSILPLTILPIGMLIYFIMISFIPLLYATFSLNLFHSTTGEEFLSIGNYNNFDTFFTNNFQYNFLHHFIFTSIILLISTLILIDKAMILRLLTSGIFLLISLLVVFLLLLTNIIYDGSIEYAIRIMLSFSFSGFGFNIASIHCIIDAIYYAFFTAGAGVGILIGLSYKFSLAQRYLFKDIILFSLITFIISITISYIIIAMLHNLGEAPSEVGIKSLYIDLPNYFYSLEDGKLLSVLFYIAVGWCYFYSLTVILIAIFTNLKANHNLSIYHKFIIFVIFVFLDILVSSIDISTDMLIKYVTYLYTFFYNIILPISIISISLITGYLRNRQTYGAIYKSIVVDDPKYRRKITKSILFIIQVVIPILGCGLLIVSILFW